jgi:hypothetical protein
MTRKEADRGSRIADRREGLHAAVATRNLFGASILTIRYPLSAIRF